MGGTDQGQEFGGRAVQILNDGALALMLSVGHKTGLLDTMATLPPSTSEEIAKAAGLQERYVREWLGAMTSQTTTTLQPRTERRLLHGD